jgi:hypothetical protein
MKVLYTADGTINSAMGARRGQHWIKQWLPTGRAVGPTSFNHAFARWTGGSASEARNEKQRPQV